MSGPHVPVERSYRPGDWFGILGRHVMVLLPPSEKQRVAPLWELVDDGADFDETLDALIASGLRNLPGFVLVSADPDETRVVLRGQVSAVFETAAGTLELDGASAATWVERSLDAATAVSVTVGAPTDERILTVDGGLVRVSRVDHPAYAADVRPPEPESAVDHDGTTRLQEVQPGPVTHGIPGQPPAPSITARPVARLVLPSGEAVDVDRAVVIGRAPEARRFSLADQPRLVTVLSPHQEISSTHVEVRPGSGVDHGSAVVTDLGSTNGTVLTQPGLAPEDLQAGIPVQLIPGAVIDLGEGVAIQVTNP